MAVLKISNDKLLMIIIILVIVAVVGYYMIQEYDNTNDQHQISTDAETETLTEKTVSEPYSTAITQTSEEQNALDRFYNPMRYPYKSPPSYYNPLTLPNQVVGCGGRNTPCIGVGSSISPIPNPLVGINVSPSGIAPTNIFTRGPLGQPQQVGVIYKINSSHNEVHPLMGRKKYPNGDKWEYYTMLGQYGSKVPIPPKRNYEELLTNDVIILQGIPGKYRVTIYDSDFPQYIPYA